MDIPESALLRILTRVDYILEESMEPLFYEIRKALEAEWREGYRTAMSRRGVMVAIELPATGVNRA